MLNILPSDRVRLVGIIDPDLNTAGTVTTGWIAMADFQSIMATIAVGDIGTSGTVDAKLEQATDASGTGAKDITGKAITQLTQAGSDSNKQVIINCRDDELDVANSFTHVRLSLTIATASTDSVGIVHGFDQRYEPETDLSTVAEIVS